MVKLLSGQYALWEKDRVIKKQAKKNKEIVYGARAMNRQLSRGFLARPTFDWDMYSKKPKKSARELEKSMDKLAGYDAFYTKPAIHAGTVKVMYTGVDEKRGTQDDLGIADYSKPKRKIKTVNIHGLKYAHISERIKDANTSLRDKESKFRHQKDRDDLTILRTSKKWGSF